MIAPFVLLFAASCFMSSASRVKVKRWFGVAPRTLAPHTLAGPAAHLSPMIRTPVNLPQLWMTVATPSDDVTPALSLNPSEMVVPTQRREAIISDTRISHQTFPPTTIYGVDTRQLLHNWADSFEALVPHQKPTGFKEYLHWLHGRDDEAMVLHNMRDALAEATNSFTQEWTPRHRIDRVGQLDAAVEAWNQRKELWRIVNAGIQIIKWKELEMVGLIPGDVDLRDIPGDVDAFVVALGVFSREQLKDDSRGSLRNKIEEQHGRQWTQNWLGSSKKQFDVFAIEGLVDAVESSESLASVLLSKIEKYAHEERKIVVAAKWKSLDGRDLTEYYVRLGFEKVEMEDGSHELVYMGGLNSMVENDKIMLGINLWTGV